MKRSCRRDEGERIDSIGQVVEKAAEMSDMKNVYETVKVLCAQRNTQRKPIKDKKGTASVTLMTNLTTGRGISKRFSTDQPLRSKQTFQRPHCWP